jgi:hypothetical protein
MQATGEGPDQAIKGATLHWQRAGSQLGVRERHGEGRGATCYLREGQVLRQAGGRWPGGPALT